ncbi:hypothetical protein F2Q70_00021312 [Brassica cretica]|uniref:Uncharacterized protein n=1 Tax=Brassica cretica TaxID=69181 RepID=A0A8S9GT83_BRACR|nr:hypothetical protein F2Q70_00021312 [Brassica cretica]
MQDRRAKGLCMFCYEVYTPDDDQTDMVAAAPDDKDHTAPVISVNAAPEKILRF